MGSKGGAKYKVVDYHMSMHWMICHGPVDALLGIFIKERDAWPGTTVYPDDQDDPETPEEAANIFMKFVNFVASVTTSGQATGQRMVATGPSPLSINRPELFGGEKKEGGVRGVAYWLPGREDQVLPDTLANRLAPGKTGVQVPGFRGIASLFFYGTGKFPGFMWGQNNPYLPPVWVQVFRRSVGLDINKSTIQRAEYFPDTNAAHLIYECLTNSLWGMGAPTTILDVASFEALADLMVTERFGLSMGWFQQASIETFVTEVLDHIQATLFVNPRTGLITVKAIRADYDPDTLRTFDESNCVAKNRARRLWGETINEINIAWTNPATEKEETLTFHDLANIAMQGATISDTRPYYGIRNPELASEVGVRDMRSASAPLFGTDIEVDRTAWDLLPGDVCKFAWAPDGLASIVMRVGRVDYGRPGAGVIKATLLEDIFALEPTEWVEPLKTAWVPSDTKPEPIEEVQIFTLPYPSLAAVGLTPSDYAYPRVVAGILAVAQGDDTTNIDVMGEGVLPNGNPTDLKLKTITQSGLGSLQTALTVQASTVYVGGFGAISGDNGPEIGGFAYIGSGTDADMEIVMLDAYNSGTGAWTLARGVMDTIPRAWPISTPIWFLDQTFDAFDSNERVALEVVEYRLLPRTALGVLPLPLATVDTFTLSDRPYRPFRPANVTIDTVAFADVVYLVAPTDINIAWANRNRLLEDTLIRRWAEGNVTPEVGQTVKIVARTMADVVLMEVGGLTGTSYALSYATLSAANPTGEAFVKIKVTAERDGYESLQAIEQIVEFRFPGYGNSYGNFYGGQ